MTAGLNIKATFWRIVANNDEVGGAVLTGSAVYQNIPVRIQANMPEQLLLQQGLSTPRLYTVTAYPASMDIRERDEMEITFPSNHKYVNDRFRIVGVNETNFHPSDGRGYLLLSVMREERSHANQ